MKLSVSNFAWDYNESKELFKYFKNLEIDNIELVLTKYKNWDELSNVEIVGYKIELNNFGLKPYSIQSLFYNVNCSIENVDIIVNHFKRLIDYSEILGTEILVFGSPGLRKKVNNFQYLLSKIFKEVDEYLLGRSINVVIEPNAPLYGGEYFSKVSEIIGFIDSNELKNIKTMIDTHNIILDNGDPIIDIDRYFDYIYHIHISEPKLLPIGDEFFHKNFSNKIKELKYNKVITYELNKCENLKDTVKLFTEIYK